MEQGTSSPEPPLEFCMINRNLNVVTKLFDENEKAGLMICGINWGGSPDSASDNETASFFSDVSCNKYPYRNKLLKWFELLGHPLETKKETVGRFERSIIQTNWLSSQSPNMHGQSLHSECVSDWDNFEFHIKELQPRLVLFLSVALLDILNSPQCLKNARQLLGTETRMQIMKKDVLNAGAVLKRFRIGIQKFGSTQIIALPHPTGSIGLSDEYIRAFAEDISPLLQSYKKECGFKA